MIARERERERVINKLFIMTLNYRKFGNICAKFGDYGVITAMTATIMA